MAIHSRICILSDMVSKSTLRDFRYVATIGLEFIFPDMQISYAWAGTIVKIFQFELSKLIKTMVRFQIELSLKGAINDNLSVSTSKQCTVELAVCE